MGVGQYPAIQTYTCTILPTQPNEKPIRVLIDVLCTTGGIQLEVTRHRMPHGNEYWEFVRTDRPRPGAPGGAGAIVIRDAVVDRARRTWFFSEAHVAPFRLWLPGPIDWRRFTSAVCSVSLV